MNLYYRRDIWPIRNVSPQTHPFSPGFNFQFVTPFPSISGSFNYNLNAFSSNLFTNPIRLIQTQSIQNFNQPSISSVISQQNEVKPRMQNDNQEISKILTFILKNNHNQIYLISLVDEIERLPASQ